MAPPPLPLPPRSELAVASLVASSLGVFPLFFLGSLVGLVLAVLALIQRYRRGHPLRLDNLVWPSLLLSIVTPLVYAYAVWALYRLIMSLLCMVIYLNPKCPLV